MSDIEAAAAGAFALGRVLERQEFCEGKSVSSCTRPSGTVGTTPRCALKLVRSHPVRSITPGRWPQRPMFKPWQRQHRAENPGGSP